MISSARMHRVTHVKAVERVVVVVSQVSPGMHKPGREAVVLRA